VGSGEGGVGENSEFHAAKGAREPVTGVYDYYGATDADLARVSEFIRKAIGVVFQLRHSDEKGDYYLAKDAAGEELTLEPNELEDEEGKYFQQADFAEYPVLLFASHRQAGVHSTSPGLDGLRQKLAGVDGLTFLQRNRVVR
jgi:hypothetical protein